MAENTYNLSDEQMAEAQKIADAISVYVNRGGSSQGKLDYLADLMLEDHRTLIQLKTRMFWSYFMKLANEHCDPRNEASVTFAKKLKEIFGGENSPRFPFI